MTPPTRPFPPTSEMVNRHTLATEIVTRPSTEVFEPLYLEQLERFVRNPSSKQSMLVEMDCVDDEGVKPGT